MGSKSRHGRVLRPVKDENVNNRLAGPNDRCFECCSDNLVVNGWSPEAGLGTGSRNALYIRTLFGQNTVRGTCCNKCKCRGNSCGVNLQCGWAGTGID